MEVITFYDMYSLSKGWGKDLGVASGKKKSERNSRQKNTNKEN